MTFVKGDPRINRKGRPKSFDQYRALVRSVLDEPAKDKEGNVIVVEGKIVTVAEMIVREWTVDRNKQPLLFEAAYGKVPQPLDVSIPSRIIVKLVNDEEEESVRDTD